jgi:glucokinase
VTHPIPVLEIGGTHVTAALIDTSSWRVDPPTLVRMDLDNHATATWLLTRLASAANALPPVSRRWGIAIPDPFDYQCGIARFHDIGKFENLNGIDIAAALRARITHTPTSFSFLNDADAFILGESLNGAATGYHRAVGITLGTGVGSGWLIDGQIVDPGNPPGGRARHLTLDGLPLERVMSRHAIRTAYTHATGDAVDVHDITQRARSGDETSRGILHYALHALGRALGPRIDDFAADIVVIGGSMAAAWDLFEPSFLAGLHATGFSAPIVRTSANGHHAPLLGAAAHVTHQFHDRAQPRHADQHR